MTLATPNVAELAPPRRWFAPRFSLKVLMIGVTALAVGSAAWWRWPVTVKTMLCQAPPTEETTTYHRGLTGNLIKHGVHRITSDEEIYFEEYYREGVRHGPYFLLESAKGVYYSGKRDGAWDFISGIHKYTYEFKKGSLVAAPKGLSGKLLLRRRAEGSLTSDRVLQGLLADIELSHSALPLSKTLPLLGEQTEGPLALRWKSQAHQFWELPDLTTITIDVKNWPLLACVDASLSPHGYALDYRFGTLCVMDAKGAEEWQDETGVMELRPTSMTPLAARLDAPASPIFFEPLPDVLRNLARDQDIPVELRVSKEEMQNRFAKDYVQLNREMRAFRGLPPSSPQEPLPITLRQLLGLILDQAELHCHEEKGVLIIEPRKADRKLQADKR